MAANSLATEESTAIMSYCGSNSVYALLRLNGIDVKLEDIANLQVVREKKRELTLLDLKTMVAHYGLTMECVKIDIDDLKLLRKPFIAHFNNDRTGGHFLVCWSTDEGVDTIDYPKKGRIEWGVFEKFYTGHALVDTKNQRSKLVGNNCNVAISRTSVVKNFKGPKFNWLSSDTLDVGTVGKNKAVEEYYKFKFSNIGNKTLIISDVKSSCTCIEAKLAKRELKPGEETSLHLRINKDRTGAFNEYCYFKTNDPEARVGKATVKGVIFSAVNVVAVPSVCEFGKVISEKTYSKKITIQNPIGEGQTAVQIKSITTTLPCIHVENNNHWTPKNPDGLNVRESFMTVSLSPDLPPGDYEEKIVITYDKGQLSIPIFFTVRPFVEVYPNICVFHIPDESISKKIILTTNRNSGFTINQIRTNSSWIDVNSVNASIISNCHELSINVDVTENDFAKSNIELSGNIGSKSWNISVPIICIKKQ